MFICESNFFKRPQDYPYSCNYRNILWVNNFFWCLGCYTWDSSHSKIRNGLWWSCVFSVLCTDGKDRQTSPETDSSYVSKIPYKITPQICSPDSSQNWILPSVKMLLEAENKLLLQDQLMFPSPLHVQTTNVICDLFVPLPYLYSIYLFSLFCLTTLKDH